MSRKHCTHSQNAATKESLSNRWKINTVYTQEDDDDMILRETLAF